MRLGDVLRELTSEYLSELRYFERRLWFEKPTMIKCSLVGKKTYKIPYDTKNLSRKGYEDIVNYLEKEGLGACLGDRFIEIIWGEKGDV